MHCTVFPVNLFLGIKAMEKMTKEEKK